MGIGMVLVVDKEAALRILQNEQGTNKIYCIGEVVNGEGLCYQ
jgi:phosphoribosylaminoimidazole (AIR) synthetase